MTRPLPDTFPAPDTIPLNHAVCPTTALEREKKGTGLLTALVPECPHTREAGQ